MYVLFASVPFKNLKNSQRFLIFIYFFNLLKMIGCVEVKRPKMRPKRLIHSEWDQGSAVNFWQLPDGRSACVTDVLLSPAQQRATMGENTWRGAEGIGSEKCRVSSFTNFIALRGKKNEKSFTTKTVSTMCLASVFLAEDCSHRIWGTGSRSWGKAVG